MEEKPLSPRERMEAVNAHFNNEGSAEDRLLQLGEVYLAITVLVIAVFVYKTWKGRRDQIRRTRISLANRGIPLAEVEFAIQLQRCLKVLIGRKFTWVRAVFDQGCQRWLLRQDFSDRVQYLRRLSTLRQRMFPDRWDRPVNSLAEGVCVRLRYLGASGDQVRTSAYVLRRSRRGLQLGFADEELSDGPVVGTSIAGELDLQGGVFEFRADLLVVSPSCPMQILTKLPGRISPRIEHGVPTECDEEVHVESLEQGVAESIRVRARSYCDEGFAADVPRGSFRRGESLRVRTGPFAGDYTLFLTVRPALKQETAMQFLVRTAEAGPLRISEVPPSTSDERVVTDETAVASA